MFYAKFIVLLACCWVSSACTQYARQELKPDRYMAANYSGKDEAQFFIFGMSQKGIVSPFIASVFVDEKLVGEIGSNSYLKFYLSPGMHNIRLYCPNVICGLNIKASVAVEKNKIYFYQVGLDLSRYTGGPRLGQISEAQASGLKGIHVENKSATN